MNPHSPRPHKFRWESSSSGVTRNTDSYRQYREDDRRRRSSPTPVTHLVNDDSQRHNIHSYPPHYQEQPSQQDYHQPTHETPSWFHSTYQRVSSLAESIIMLPSGLSNMSSPPIDARNVSDDRIQSDDTSTGKRIGLHPQYETTLQGDVVVVQPSFDDHDSTKSPKSPSPVKRSQQEWQARSPQQDRKEEVKDDSSERNPSSPPREEPSAMERRHIRNLSAHFYDATSLEDDPAMYTGGHDHKKHNSGDDGSVDSGSGRKHRRIFSGDHSNPNLAHRRTNSIGNSVAVDRQYHHREHSAGLDILSAAVLVDVSKDELAAAAGQTYGTKQHDPALRPSWEHPSAMQHHQFRYASGHPLSGPPAYPHLGNDNPHMHPPNRRLGGGPNIPPSLPALPSTSHHPYGPPPHHHGYAPHPASSYPPHSYHHHQGMPHQPHHYQGISAPVSYYQSPYPARGPVRPPDSPHTSPYPSQHYVKNRIYSGETRKPENPVSNLTARTQGPPLQSASVDQGWTPTSSIPPANKGSQTFVTAIAVGSGKKTIRATSRLKNASTNTEAGLAANKTSSVPSQVMGHHHRKMSSFSSVGLGTIFGAGPGLSPGAPDTPPTHGLQHPLKSALAPHGERKPHHRSISSVSFLHGLDPLGHENDLFLRNLQESVPEYRSPANSLKDDGRRTSPVVSTQTGSKSTGNNSDVSSDNNNTNTKLASGGTSKRVRRKCTISGCRNRVVQGGLCITHGAKRKVCNHPGCPKNVKKAGFCSTHGPARKTCNAPNCPKVAVQGGHCIAHGAKKKLCCLADCNKQAILSGMCKRHHDQNKGKVPAGVTKESASYCREVAPEATRPPQHHNPTHTRGLSIFHDISADAVSSLLNNTADGVDDPMRAPDGNNSPSEISGRPMW